MAAGKINLQANDGKVLGLYAPDGMSANTDIVPSSVNGDATKVFKVANAVNADEAVSKAQLDLKATLTEAQAYDLGVGQTWQDVKANRSAGVTYTNTTGKPIMVAVKGSVNSSADIHIYINGVSIQSQQGTSSAATVPHSITTVIPNGANYKVTSTFAPIKWFELR